MLKTATGADFVHVHYRGAGPAVRWRSTYRRTRHLNDSASYLNRSLATAEHPHSRAAEVQGRGGGEPNPSSHIEAVPCRQFQLEAHGHAELFRCSFSSRSLQRPSPERGEV